MTMSSICPDKTKHQRESLSSLSPKSGENNGVLGQLMEWDLLSRAKWAAKLVVLVKPKGLPGNIVSGLAGERSFAGEVPWLFTNRKNTKQYTEKTIHGSLFTEKSKSG